MSDLVYTDDAGKDFQIRDVLLHCLAPHIKGLYTLCGTPYENVMYANDPIAFKKYANGYKEVEVCQECKNHPDLPLAMLGDVG